MPLTKDSPNLQTPLAKKQFEIDLTREFIDYKNDAERDLFQRINGVSAKSGSSGYQLAGYTTLERFYRGDQWAQDEPPGASQRTDNYCAVIVDNLSSLIFDDKPEVNCPSNDPTDDIEEIKAEIKEDLILKVWKNNDYAVEFDEWAKSASLYGDGFLKGPWIEKDKKNKWRIRFAHVENPASILPIFDDVNFKELIGFIDQTRISLAKAERLYGEAAKQRGIVLSEEIHPQPKVRIDNNTNVPMVHISEYWTDKIFAVFVNDKLLDYYFHNWGFVPLQHVKNIYIPNYPYGKSDIEDVLDPQLMHNRVNNDLANLLRWISSVNLWGKNLEGMQALVAGLSRIYSLPEDGELHAFEKTGDPYIANTFVAQRRNAIIDVSGISEAMLSASQLSLTSGRALALAFQGTIRKLNPRIKRFASALERLNENILKLYEIYFPETKMIIEGNYNNEVFISSTLLRNVIDTINKLQSGIISLDTAQKEAGVRQPRLEQKLIKKNLSDPIIGPQFARQPALLPRLQEGENQPGEQPIPGPGQKFSSPSGMVAMLNQNASGAAPVPINITSGPPPLK